MKVVLAGASGLIGRRLMAALLEEKHEVVLLTRLLRQGEFAGISQRLWDGVQLGEWVEELEGADAVVNLAGAPIDRRWSRRQKERILESRLGATRALADAVRGAQRKPRVLLNASGVDFYGDVPAGDVTESSPPGSGFLAETCVRWEAEALSASGSGVRVALLRFAVVLDPQGGALRKILLPYRAFLGGVLGSGEQYFSWIHPEDLVCALKYVLATPALEGPVNLSSPEPVTMRQFCLALGNVLHRPSWFPVPPQLLRLLLGEMSSTVLTGRRALPVKLLEHGYAFQHANLLEALESILT
jgi:uncharacterized protein (TIGR01777 family)